MDAFALIADGSAKDPAAFQAALRADKAKLAEVQEDPQLEAILLGDDLNALQQLLKDTFQVPMPPCALCWCRPGCLD